MFGLLSKFSKQERLGSLIVSKVEYLISCNWFSPILTLYFNFRLFPLSQALRLPVYIYGKPKFLSLHGQCRIAGKVFSGMIKINDSALAPGNSSIPAEFVVDGSIVFYGRGRVAPGCKFMVFKTGFLEVGDEFKFQENCNIAVFGDVKIGNYVRITHECQLLDSSFHYMVHLESRKVNKLFKPIVIGNYNWIGNRTTIMGGTITNDFTIVASNSLLNKDYSSLPSDSIIGGAPAKFINSGYRRIENEDLDKHLNVFFMKSFEKNECVVGIDVPFCKFISKLL